jgi:hypothetical protein
MHITVRIKDPRYDIRDRYARSCNIPEYNDYTGNIVPRFSWLDDNWFVLTTGDKNAPYRIIHKDSIICGWLGSSDMSTDFENTVVSIPRGNKSYTVSMCDDSSLVCDCTGFGYRRTCSHIREVEEAA